MHHSTLMPIKDSTNSGKVLYEENSPKEISRESFISVKHIVFSQSGIAATVNFTVHLCAAPTYLRVASISLEYPQLSNQMATSLCASLHRYNIANSCYLRAIKAWDLIFT